MRAMAIVAAAALAVTGAAAQTGAAQTGNASLPARHGTVPAICSRSSGPYHAPIAILRWCGDTVAPLRRVTSLPGGGKAYDYGYFTQLVPPAQFSVLTASDRQLREYGLPTRARLGARWYPLMRDVRRFAPAPRYLAEVPPEPAQTPATPLCGPPTSNSPTWSGYCVTGKSFTGVSTQWEEPNFVPAGCSGDQFRQWAGIGGGTGQDDLARAGTTFNVPGFAAHQAFIEAVSNGSGSLTAANIEATPDQQFYASVSWDSSTSEFGYFMENLHTGAVYMANSRPVTRDGSTAEVITERPSPTGQLSAYQHLAIQNATASWGSGSSGLAGLPNTSLFIRDGNNPVSIPGNLTSGSGWTMTWHLCG